MKPRKLIWRSIRFACILTLLITLLAPIPLGQAASATVSFVWSTISRTSPQQDSSQENASQTPSRKYVPRIKLLISETHELTFDEAIVAVTILDPNLVAAETKGARNVVLTGLNAGDTILIISGDHSRSTYVLQVMHPPRAAARLNGNLVRGDESAESVSGFYGVHFAPGFEGVPSLLRHDFEFNQKLSGGRTLRASGEMFNFFGGGERLLAQPLGASFGMNRVRLGVDSPTGKFDLLDSELEISRLSFNNYTVRGPHYVSKSDSRWNGLEIFAGRARPQSSLFNEGEGLLAGALVPVAQGSSWRIRSGAFFVSPQRRLAGQESGIIWQTDGRYAPDEKTNAEAEMAYANGGLSWRARLDLQRGAFNFYGELFKLDKRSPLVAIGAQISGRRMNSFGLQWRPNTRFAASLAYHSATNFPLPSSRRLELNSQRLTATASYTPRRGTRFGFSFNQQEIEQPTTLALPFLLNLQTRTATLRYGQRFAQHWTNDFEARFILSREGHTDEAMTRGAILREQLRYSWRRGSLAGFINYRSNTPSLTGLIVRNPSLLPDELRAAFALDPARFLLLNRDALPHLLPGVELPLTRNTEAGLRLQAAFSRLNLSSEVRYGAGESLGFERRDLLATVSADFKLDAANSIQVSGSRDVAFDGTGTRNTLAVSYVHRFGSASGGGFQFSRLLGTARGRVQGRVFFDTNGNGQDDAEEPGVPAMKIQMDGDQTLTTDARGRFTFKALDAGEHHIALVSDDLGVRLRASNATLRQLFLAPRETSNVSFGITNFGFAAGRIFNDLFLTGELRAGAAPGVGDVKIILRPTATGGNANAAQPLTEIINAGGMYEFRNLAPGSYMLEIDPASIPADFSLPRQTSWPILINPLQGSYTDVPLIAQRAISGIVFIDRDGNGLFDPSRDEVVKGARVVAGRAEGLTDNQGAYILRNLPAGRIELCAFLPDSKKRKTIYLELPPNPIFRKNINLTLSE